MNSLKFWITNWWQILFHLYPYQLSTPRIGPEFWPPGVGLELGEQSGHNLREHSLSELYLLRQAWWLTFCSLGLPHLRSSFAGSAELFWSKPQIHHSLLFILLYIRYLFIWGHKDLQFLLLLHNSITLYEHAIIELIPIDRHLGCFPSWYFKQCCNDYITYVNLFVWLNI